MEHVTKECQCTGKNCIGCKENICFLLFGLRKKEKGLVLGNLNSYCRKCDGKRGGEKIKQQRNANAKRWAETHRGDMRQHVRNWYERHPDYRPSHRQEHAEAQRKHAQTEGGRLQVNAKAKRRHARKLGAVGSHTLKEWGSLKAFYQYTCLRCGRQEPEIKLTEDHVIPLSKGGSNYLDNIQPLCVSCNTSKKDKIMDFRPQNT